MTGNAQKRNIYGWNKLKYYKVNNNEAERNQRNGKIVEHVDGGPVNNLSHKEKAPVYI